jgi:hypothetical protein
MEIERLLPLLIIWIIWRILTYKRKADKEKTGAPPVFSKEGSEIPEPVPVAAPLPSPSIGTTGTGDQPMVTKTVVPPPAMPAGQARRGMMGADRSFLQQAVVWAEILAPPVGLRDNF